MNNTMQLYIDEKKEIKGYPITSPDRVIDENGVSIKEQLEHCAKKDDVAKISSGTPLFASSTTEMTDTTKNYVNTTDGYLYIYSGGNWTKTTVQYQSSGIADKSITDNKISDKSYIAFKKRMSLNMFDKSRITDNCYINYTNGQLSGYNANYCVTDFIELTELEKYRWSPSNQQWCYFDANRNYVSGKATVYTEFNNIATPAGVKYVRFTLEKSNLDKALLYSVSEYESGIWNNSDYTYKNGILADAFSTELEKQVMRIKKVYTVKQDGTGDFTTIEQANAKCLNGKENARYKILVYPGTYNITKDFCPNNYVDIVGINRETCIITLQQADTETKANIEQYSTFNLKYNNEIKNLTITCKNARYPIHDDGGVADITRVIENCHIEHLGNQGARTQQSDTSIWSSECAYGMGTRSGNKAYFKDCTFKSNFIPWSTHNNINFTSPCFIEHDNCNFILGTSPIGSYKYSIRIMSDGSLVKDRIVFKGCKSNYPMLLQDSWLGDTANKNRVEWIIEGYNNDIPFASEYTTGEMQVPEFSDEVRIVQATEDIVKGNLCVYDGALGKVRKMLTTDDISIFAGIAIEDKTNGNLVKLKYKGYAYKKWITTLNTPFGTLFGCGSDSKLAVVTDKSKAILIGMGTDILCLKFL